jgi:hypothetical protein
VNGDSSDILTTHCIYGMRLHYLTLAHAGVERGLKLRSTAYRVCLMQLPTAMARTVCRVTCSACMFSTSFYHMLVWGCVQLDTLGRDACMRAGGRLCLFPALVWLVFMFGIFLFTGSTLDREFKRRLGAPGYAVL